MKRLAHVPVVGALFVLMTVAPSPAALGQPQTTPSPEMQRLSKAIVGTFTVVETHHARPGGSEWTARGTATYAEGPDRMSVVEDYRSTGPRGPFSAVAVVWWDAEAGAFRHFECESGEACGVVDDKGAWEEQAVVFVRHLVRQDRKIRYEERYDFSRADTIVITASLSVDGGPLVTGMTITYTRVPGR